MSPIANYLLSKLQNTSGDDQPAVFDRSRLNQQQEVLLRSIINEFYCSAKLMVVFTSIVNARLQGVGLQNISRPSSFMPTEPLIFHAVASGLTPSFGHPELIGVLQDYYARLAFARAFSVLPPAGEPGPQNVHHLELLQIADVWRRVCDLANLVAHQLYDVETTRGTQTHPLVSIHELIRAAQRGQAPCVRNDGLVAIPGWLDQRREERKSLGWKVWLTAEGRRERATLQDISLSGMGLADCPTLAIGAQISVQLPDSRCFTGVVTWSQANRLGARFLMPISANDPVLSDLARSAFSSMN